MLTLRENNEVNIVTEDYMSDLSFTKEYHKLLQGANSIL